MKKFIISEERRLGLISIGNNFPLFLLTISLVPPTIVANTGIEADMASIIETGIPSEELTKDEQLQIFNIQNSVLC